jgi:transglutaminase-like putative cysteine protease
MNSHLQTYLEPTFFLDYLDPAVTQFAEKVSKGAGSPKERAIRLYYAVRDSVLYDPFDLRYDRQAMQASTILQKQRGYCVAKAVLLAAVARQQRIPARLGFADVTNHISTPKLRAKMGTDLFVYHGYTEFLLDGRWVKATPAFNLSLCRRFNVKPLEFDGNSDSIFHEFDARGQKHMEYVTDHGHFADLPFELIFQAYQRTYPKFFDHFPAR